MNHTERILNCCHHEPFQYLGAHFSDSNGPTVTLRTFQPNAIRVDSLEDGNRWAMEQIHKKGLFAVSPGINHH